VSGVFKNGLADVPTGAQYRNCATFRWPQEPRQCAQGYLSLAAFVQQPHAIAEATTRDSVLAASREHRFGSLRCLGVQPAAANWVLLDGRADRLERGPA
jgi:hypothetical protein